MSQEQQSVQAIQSLVERSSLLLRRQAQWQEQRRKHRQFGLPPPEWTPTHATRAKAMGNRRTAGGGGGGEAKLEAAAAEVRQLRIRQARAASRLGRLTTGQGKGRQPATNGRRQQEAWRGASPPSPPESSEGSPPSHRPPLSNPSPSPSPSPSSPPSLHLSSPLSPRPPRASPSRGALQKARLRHLPSSTNATFSRHQRGRPAQRPAWGTEAGGEEGQGLVQRGRRRGVGGLSDGLRYVLTGQLSGGRGDGWGLETQQPVLASSLSTPYEMSHNRVRMKGGEESAFAHCSICTSELLVGQVVRTVLSCGHSFHQPCARRLITFEAPKRKAINCPVCRAPFTAS